MMQCLFSSNIDQFGVHEWIGSNYESIKTKDGLIIETKGLAIRYQILFL